MLAPKTTPAGSAPNSRPTVRRVRSSSSSHAAAAANTPPQLAVLPLADHVAVGVDRGSTICVPAGPSKRAQPSPMPGNRRRRSSLAVTTIRSLGSLIAGSMADTLVSWSHQTTSCRSRCWTTGCSCASPRRTASGASRAASSSRPRRRSPSGWCGPRSWRSGRTCAPPRSATRCCSARRTATRSRCGGNDYIMLRERDLHAVAAERIEASHRPVPVIWALIAVAWSPMPTRAHRSRRDGRRRQRRRAGAGHRPGRRHRRRVDDGVDERRERCR